MRCKGDDCDVRLRGRCVGSHKIPYSHKIPDVVAIAMDSKGKEPTPIYRVVNMADRSRKRKAPTVEPTDSERS